MLERPRPLTPIADGLWIDVGPVSILGMPLTATMTLVRLADGGLLLHSPLALTPERRAAVDALGPLAHLYAPNLFHHLWLGDWAAAYPHARVHAPAGLTKKRPDLRVDRVHGAPEAAFAGVLDEHVIQGFRLGEAVLHAPPARTLIVTDLVHNIGRPPGLWTLIYAGAMGFYGRVALSRAIRWTAFSDRAAARRSLDALLALDIERVIVGHGAPIDTDPRRALAAAFAWLR